MAKKRTSKSRSSLNKKSGFFTKRKIALGVALIALIGIGVVLYSNAAVGDPPVEKTLFCNQGNCYETQAQGTQRSSQKVFVRETNKLACASTGKEWATRANKAPGQWVCVKNEDPNAALVVPSNFVAVNTPCYKAAMPPGVTTTNLGTVEDRCQVDYQKSNTNLNFQVSAIFSQQNYIDTANAIKQQLESDGKRIRNFNTNFMFGGQKAVKIVSTVPDNQPGSAFLQYHIVTNTPSTTGSIHPTTTVSYQKIKNNTEGVLTTNTNNMVDIVIAQWQWQNQLDQNMTELSIPGCFKATIPSASTVQSPVCDRTFRNINLIPSSTENNIAYTFIQAPANATYTSVANGFENSFKNNGYTIKNRKENTTLGGVAAVSYEAERPNDKRLVIFPDIKNEQNQFFNVQAFSYTNFKALQDDVLASWQWL